MIRHFYHRPMLKEALSPAKLWATVAEGDDEALPPSLLAAMTELLAGALTLETIVASLLQAGFEVEPIILALEKLDRAGLLVEAPSSELSLFNPEELARYEPQIRMLAALAGSEHNGMALPLPVQGLSAQSALKKATVVILDVGLNGLALARNLTLAGIGHLVILTPWPEVAVTAKELATLNPGVRVTIGERVEDLPAAQGETPIDLLVYCPDTFDEALADHWNNLSLKQDIPFLPYRQRGLDIELGPLVIPRQTACYRCFQLRRAAAAAVSAPAAAPQRDGDGGSPPQGWAFPIGIDWLALEVIKFLTAIAEPVTYTRLWQFNLLQGMASVHPVLKLPRCPVCGVHRRQPPHRLWEG